MSPVPTPDIELQIPPRPEYVGVVRHLMGAVARLGQHTPEFVENAKLTASEATTNAVALTGQAGTTDRIEVVATLEPDRLEIVVSDRGEGVLGAEPPPVTSDTPAAGFDSGLSLPLLEGLVDDLRIEDRDGGGNVVHLVLIRDIDEGGSGG